MISASRTLRAALILASAGTGCRDNSPPPQRVPIPSSDRDRDRISLREREIQPGEPDPYERRTAYRDHDPIKPLPPQNGPQNRENEFRPPYDDAPLINQRPPEERAFVESYRKVGSPRITVFINRTLEGTIVPVNTDEAVIRAERRTRVSGNIDIESNRRDEVRDRWGDDRRESTDRVKSTGPGEVRESAAIYLRPGQYDEVQAKSLDYEAMENIMTDWLAASGQVTVISPTMARQRLTDQQVKELQDGRPTALSEIAQRLDADILIQVQAHPTRQTREGLEVRIITEAINTKGGQSIGRAVVDVPPPLEKTTINRFTRFLARKLMDDMTATWSAPPPPEDRPADRAPRAVPREGSPAPAEPLPEKTTIVPDAPTRPQEDPRQDPPTTGPSN